MNNDQNSVGNPTRRVLIVSPHWPPVNAPDMQRVRMSLPFYAAHGWQPVVLAVHPDDVAATREEALGDTYPASARIVLVRAWSLRWTRLFGLGNLGLRAWWPLLRAGARLLRRERFDLVFFSNTQFVTFTLGVFWRLRWRVPFVVDVQDPWRTDYYERPGAPRPPGGWKYRLARLQAFLLEGPTYRRAAGFISVSPRYLEELTRRYRWFAAKPQATIRFGVAPNDFEVARKSAVGSYALERRSGEIHFVYTGAAGPIMPHALNTLLEALRGYRTNHPAAAARFRFHFLGTSYVAQGAGRHAVLPVAESFGVSDLVAEVPYRLGHLECVKLLLQADALLLLGSSDLAYSPSKLFPYYLSAKPMLSVVFHGSHLESLLTELNCSIVASLRLDSPRDAALATIHHFLDLAIAGFPTAELPSRHEAYFHQNYLAGTLTCRQCDLFERAVVANQPRG